jgi:thymidylate synthase
MVNSYDPNDPNRFRSDIPPQYITQWEWAYNSLIKDKDTRQAIFFFNQPQYQYYGNKDFPCTIYGIFEIRDNKLNLSIKMRSNDLILGLQADIVFFVTLLQHMHFFLKETYPDLQIGSYYHYVDSLHIYERHYDLVSDMLQHDFKSQELQTLTKPLINLNGTPSDDILKMIQSWDEKRIAPELSLNEIIC